MTTLQFLIANSWVFVGLSVCSIVCAFLKDFLVGKFMMLKQESLFNASHFDNFKQIKGYLQFGLGLIVYGFILFGKKYSMITFAMLALLSIVLQK